jgi:hypothetical protein
MKKILILTIVALSFLWGAVVSATIYSYSKVTDQFTTYTVVEPDYKEGDSRMIELCVIDGTTYIFVPDILILPEQPAQIVLSEVVLDEALCWAIENASSRVQLINQRIASGILTIAEGEVQKRSLGYIPNDFKTPNEKIVDAEIDMKTSIWWQKTDAQLNTIIDNNWDDPVKRKAMFKKLVKQVADIARRGEWDN